ncbi:MAG: prepilin-type N-terminal cleavage/methylation domain-containing protein [Methylococcales bacterium]|nr:prepilin-type N-terminal cleavage/methylation domain-containing protein [Methylococcales bacterium]
MKKQQGFTLIEIMLALVLGLFIITATLTVYVHTIASSADTIKSARLNHDLGMTMSLMANDIKRAGYWGGAVIVATPNTTANPTSLHNPFTTATSISIGINITANDCILYTYDANSSGALTPTVTTDDIDTNEYFGFRKSNTSSIQIRSTNVPCNDATGAWESITDEAVINITDVQFSFTAMAEQAATTAAPIHPAYPALIGTSRCLNNTTTASPNTNDTIDCTGIVNTPAATVAAPHSCAVNRVVNIRLSGSVVNDADARKSISSTVEIKNNRLFQKTS